MEWSDIRVFLAIAREGTLGAAARKVGQTQPTMGRRLRTLEAALGNKLFQRTTHGFTLTDEGAALLPRAERMEEEALAIERQNSGQAQHLEGVLRVTSMDWFGGYVLSTVLTEFAALHPYVVIELLTDQRFLSLSRREADLAFRFGPFDEPDVVSRKLLQLRYGAYIRKGLKHPKAGDGAGANLMALHASFAGTPDDTWLQRILPNARTTFRSNSRNVQAKMCAEGAGVAILPCDIGDMMDGIERLHLGDEPPTRDVWIGYHRDLGRLARLRALLDLTLARLAG
ncbi:MAG TPA: LysR family transcriptional regulator [Caulobacteraceae bacterium]|jgi:DNA-binding transcriptional LysR family regulator